MVGIKIPIVIMYLFVQVPGKNQPPGPESGTMTFFVAAVAVVTAWPESFSTLRPAARNAKTGKTMLFILHSAARFVAIRATF